MSQTVSRMQTGPPKDAKKIFRGTPAKIVKSGKENEKNTAIEKASFMPQKFNDDELRLID